jgi:hypothetical protein
VRDLPSSARGRLFGVLLCDGHGMPRLGGGCSAVDASGGCDVRCFLSRPRAVVLPGSPAWPVSLLLSAKPSLEDCYGGADFGLLGKLGPDELGVDGVAGKLAGW